MKRGLAIGALGVLVMIALACNSAPAASGPGDVNQGSESGDGGSSIQTGQFALLLTAMADGRSYLNAEVLPDGRVMVIGGRSKGVSEWPIVHARVEIFDPTTQAWTDTGALADERQQPAVAVFPDGKVLVAGGTDTSINPYNRAEIWDPATGEWTPAGRMKQYRELPQGVGLDDGRAMVVGGISKTFKPLTIVEVYDPVTGEWEELAPTSAGHRQFTLTKLSDGKVLAAGGGALDGPWLDVAEVYDPSTDTWTLTGPMITGRTMHTATLLQDGRVLVVGGVGKGTGDHGVALSSAEIYDPATNEWTSAGNTRVTRSEHATSLMGDGRAIVVGGVGDTKQSEIYNPSTGTWSAGPSLIESRYRFAAVTLHDGSVLAIAGQSSEKVLHTVERYKP
ncbi:MAG: hypothetical protein O2854_03545 [Chloroflexi bacterium]|nr:hypothetical protein [Chloroflexota bacterium]